MMLFRKETGQMMKKSMQVCLGNQILTAFSDGSFTFSADNTEWQFEGGSILAKDTVLPFEKIECTVLEKMETGTGTGIRIRYTGQTPLSFEIRL